MTNTIQALVDAGFAARKTRFQGVKFYSITYVTWEVGTLSLEGDKIDWVDAFGSLCGARSRPRKTATLTLVNKAKTLFEELTQGLTEGAVIRALAARSAKPPVQPTPASA